MSSQCRVGKAEEIECPARNHDTSVQQGTEAVIVNMSLRCSRVVANRSTVLICENDPDEVIGVVRISSQHSIGRLGVRAFQVHSGRRDDYSVDEVDVLESLDDLVGIVGRIVVVRVCQLQEFGFERLDGVPLVGIGPRSWQSPDQFPQGTRNWVDTFYLPQAANSWHQVEDLRGREVTTARNSVHLESYLPWHLAKQSGVGEKCVEQSQSSVKRVPGILQFCCQRHLSGHFGGALQ